MTIHVRCALDTDLPMIIRIWMDGADCSFPVADYDPQFLAERFAVNFSGRTRVFDYWVAEAVGGKVVGWQALQPMSRNPFRSELFAESSTYVSREARGQGVGRLLLSHALKEFSSTTLKYVIGSISPENIAALHLTQSLGWQGVGEIPESKKPFATAAKRMIIYVL